MDARITRKQKQEREREAEYDAVPAAAGTERISVWSLFLSLSVPSYDLRHSGSGSSSREWRGEGAGMRRDGGREKSGRRDSVPHTHTRTLIKLTHRIRKKRERRDGKERMEAARIQDMCRHTMAKGRRERDRS